jgi:hypothetical protein
MSEFTISRSHIIYIPRFHKADFDKLNEIAGNLADDKLRENMIEIVDYKANPAAFTTLAAWPLKSNCRCWSCGLFFDVQPKFIPTYIKQARGVITEMGTEGNFCSFPCAQRYLNTIRDSTYDDRCRMLCELHKIFTGATIYKIMPAPSPTLMWEYCGNSRGISAEKYRDLYF